LQACRKDTIAAATGMSKGAVTNTVQRAVQQELGWPLPEDLDDSRLEALLYRRVGRGEEFWMPVEVGFED
jgi:hypothetical protein